MEDEGGEFTFENKKEEIPKKDRVGQDQLHGLLFSEQLSWQSLIYDLINTNQLDPWDIDISLLSNKYLEKIKFLEEANFFISSKVLLAASFLLRIKSEILLSEDIKSLDEILFGKKEEKRYIQERIELDEDIPGLIPRSPLPRYRKVSLAELISALGKAITTENRRIQKVVLTKQQEMEASLSLPKRQINLKDEILRIHLILDKIFSSHSERYPFTALAGTEPESKVATFVPLLHLDTQTKILLEQDGHCEEIWIWMKEMHEKKYADELFILKQEAEKAIAEEVAEQDREDEKLN